MFYTRQNEFNLIAGIVADRMGVRFVREGSDWKVDMRERIIYYPTYSYLTEQDIGFLLHEAAHLRFTFATDAFQQQFKSLCEKAGKDVSQLIDLLRAFEDVRVNAMLKAAYPGAARYLDESHAAAMDENLQNLATLSWQHGVKFSEFLKTIAYKQHNLYLVARGALPPAYAQEFYDYYMDERARRAVDVNRKFIRQIERNTRTRRGYYQVFRKLLPAYLPLCEDAKQASPQQKREAEQAIEKVAEAIAEALVQALQQAAKNRQQRKDGEPQTKLLERYARGGNGQGGEGGFQYIPSDSISKMLGFDWEWTRESMPIEVLNAEVDENLAAVRRAASILKDVSFERYEGSYLSGRLQSRRLYKLSVGRANIFSRKVATLDTDKDMAVMLLVDASGSMADGIDYKRGDYEFSRSGCACVVATLLGRAMEYAGRPYAVMAFSGDCWTVKKWGERANPLRMVALSETRSNTNETGAVDAAMEELRKRQERNKVLIVINDGGPDNGTTLAEAIREAEKTAKVYAIGIDNDGVKDYYRRSAVVHTAQGLAGEVAKIFRENAGGRRR